MEQKTGGRKMIDSIPNPLTDKGVQKDIKEKVDELMSRRVTSYNEGVADTIRRQVGHVGRLPHGMAGARGNGWRQACRKRLN